MNAKPKLPPYLEILSKAMTFDDAQSGEGGASENWKSYLAATDSITGLESSDLQWLLHNASPAGRLYAAVLMKQSSRFSNEDSFGKLLNDDAKVTYLSGCKGCETTVKEIAKTFIDTGKYHNFSFSMFCKLRTPTK